VAHTLHQPISSFAFSVGSLVLGSTDLVLGSSDLVSGPAATLQMFSKLPVTTDIVVTLARYSRWRVCHPIPIFDSATVFNCLIRHTFWVVVEKSKEN
jgi:hypothetical protein